MFCAQTPQGQCRYTAYGRCVLVRITGSHHLADEERGVAIYSCENTRLTNVTDILQWRLRQRDCNGVLLIEYPNGEKSKIVPRMC